MGTTTTTTIVITTIIITIIIFKYLFVIKLFLKRHIFVQVN